MRRALSWPPASLVRWCCPQWPTKPGNVDRGSDGTNPAWAACGRDWVAREDAKLNAAWKRLLAASGPATRRDLLEEQRAWNAFMQKACRFYDNGEFGREGQVLHFPACRARIIAERTATLDSYGADRR